MTVIRAGNKTTPGFVGLYIIIGRLSQKIIKKKKKEAKISSGAPIKEIEGMQRSLSSNRDQQLLNLEQCVPCLCLSDN